MRVLQLSVDADYRRVDADETYVDPCVGSGFLTAVAVAKVVSRTYVGAAPT
jgi:hypothetical protein